jgi:enamine deaminase RidA (YjgF/YER057c/UK114 family)
MDLSHVVEMTSYHVGLRKHLDTFIKVKDEFIVEPYPAWTAVGVGELITAGTLVEIRVIARRR